MICAAEGRLGSLVHPIRPADAVGELLPGQSSTQPFQQIFLRGMRTIPLHPETIGLPNELAFHPKCPRIDLLYRQGPWVAVDEFTFYMNSVGVSHQAHVVPPLIMPLFTTDDELVQILKSWMGKCFLAMGSHTRLLTALLVDNHWFPVYLRAHPMGIAVTCTPDGQSWMEIAVADVTHAQRSPPCFCP